MMLSITGAKRQGVLSKAFLVCRSRRRQANISESIYIGKRERNACIALCNVSCGEANEEHRALENLLTTRNNLYRALDTVQVILLLVLLRYSKNLEICHHQGIMASGDARSRSIVTLRKIMSLILNCHTNWPVHPDPTLLNNLSQIAMSK